MWSYYLSCLFFVLTGAAIQEITFYESANANEGNSFTFRKHLPDTSNPLLKNITRFCKTGEFFCYHEVNYTGTSYHYLGSCHNVSLSICKSFRFTGNPDTEIDGVSLYTSDFLRGKEIYIDHSPFAGINVNISSLGWTGPSNWTLFEGVNFDGNHACLPGTHKVGSPLFINMLGNSTKLKTIGSLAKGCLTQVTPEMQADLRRQAGAAQS